MSINVTVNGNPLSIKRGRMVLSDLDQIKKNEKDRRRRLRLEQVRQQSKEISDRLLERVKNIAKEELKKFENSDKQNLKEIYNEKIMEVQQKYQEDMADIGEAHISAMLEPDYNAVIQGKEKRNKLAALKRGKQAMKDVNNTQKDMVQQLHRERLHQVRDLEKRRSTMVAELPQNTIQGKNVMREDIDEKSEQHKPAKKRIKKIIGKKSPGKITKSYIKVVTSDFKTCSPFLRPKPKSSCIHSRNGSSVPKKQCVVNSFAAPSTSETVAATKNTERVVDILESECNDKNSRKAISTSNDTPIEIDKISRYNPEDYVQPSSDSTVTNNANSSNSFSDDSSYFSDNSEQPKCTRISKRVSCPANNKVHLYDHSKHQSNMYEKPVGVVEKIHLWNEPSAIDLAQEIDKPQTTETHVKENRKFNAQKRGEDAVLREKVRRDYQAFVQNLSQLASEERKLKASQIEHYPKDVHMQEERRRVLRDEHKKKLNRALKTLLNEECLQQYRSCPMEKQITLTPRENNKSDETHVSWDVPCSSHKHTETSRNSQNKCKENETSREEQILSMLQKVEKQRQLLLKEFGANLPNDIFNATIKPLFEKEKLIHAQSIISQETDIQKTLSPEIRVINSSCRYESIKKNEMGEKNNSSIGKVEIAVQTTTGSKHNIAEDKSIQVELIQEKESDFNSIINETKATTTHYPIEPKVTVIRPKADSSESTSSVLTNIVTDNDKQDPKVTSRNKKHNVKTLHQVPLKKFQKSCSMRVSKIPSFTKKFPKSLRKSRYSNLKKMHNGTADVPSKRIKIYVNNNGFNIKVNPPQTADIAVDVSTQSSRVYLTGTQEQSTSKLNCVQSQSKRIKRKDISDSSTSFASPPPMKPKDIFEVLNNNFSILEMLDSSANESIKFLKRDISPVSTPETPSPRTMKMPSNVPHSNKISRMLRYASTDTQINDNSILSSTKSGYSTSTDMSDYQQNEHVSSESITTLSKQPLVSLEFCLCKNPECKLMHAKFDNIHNYAVKNCPQILQNYEDLQNMCAERIVSLTNLIEKVRNDQKGMELSGISAGDETSLMQLPPPQLMTNDLQSIRKLVENIEAIHNQLAKTLIESQKIIKNKVVVNEETHQTKEMEVITLTNGNTSKNVTHSIDSKAKVPKTKTKPKIISEERVNIQLDAFQIQHRPQTLMSIPAERNFWHSSKFHDEKVIEMISKDILEQSKSFSNNAIVTKESDNSMVNHVSRTSTDINDSKHESSLKTQRNGITTEKRSNKEFKKTKDFVPLLADIPKISRTIENAMFYNGRSKPPVSLLSGPYRAEIESSGHELSTIIEFDIPDTLNKSQNNIRSPLSVKKIAETQITKPAGLMNPSEHDSLLITQGENLEKLYTSSISKLPSVVPKQKVEEIVPFSGSSKVSESMDNRNLMKNKQEKKTNVTPETSTKKLQCDTANQHFLQIEELQPISPIITSPNKQDKNNKDYITSTSSNSFSGLSGVSQIASTPSSDIFKYASSPEEMEIALKKLGLGWAITTLKKTREASALSSSSNSDERTPINTAKRIISPGKKQFDSNYGLPDFSDVSSISIKEASKSTEQAVLQKGRTSTPKLQNSNSSSTRMNSRNTNISENDQEPGDGLVIPNMSLLKTKSIKKLDNH